MITLNPGNNIITLASSSPRRREILEREGFKVEVFKPDQVEEISLGGKFDTPEKVVVENSLRKVSSYEGKKDQYVLASDTIVVLKNKQFGKPSDLNEAVLFLKELAGRTHQVYSGFALKKNNSITTGHDISFVSFKDLKDEDISLYLNKVNVLDKAGAYAIQEKGEMIIDKLKGSFNNVMGLPIEKILQIFKDEKS